MEHLQPGAPTGALRPAHSAEPSPSWASALSEAITRSYRSFVDSFGGGQSLGDRAIAVPAAGVRAADAKETKESKETKHAPTRGSDAPVRPVTLASVWPGHVFGSRAARSACETLLTQKGQWNPKAIHNTLARLDAGALTEVGEFCAYLQADPSLRGCQVLSQVLADVAVRPSWPLSGMKGELPGLWLAGSLAIGLLRGLVLSEQAYSLRHFLQRLTDRDQTLDCGSVIRGVFAMRNALTDSQLQAALEGVQGIEQRNGGGVRAHLHALAASGEVIPADLHRLARLATPLIGGPRQNSERVLWDWLGVLEAPVDARPVVPPDLQFAIGHGVATACGPSAPSRQCLGWFVDDAPGSPSRRQWLEAPYPTAAARTGALWALDPLQRLAQLPLTPNGTQHAQAWAQLPARLRGIDPVQWYRTVEKLDVPMDERYRLQRLALGQEAAFATVRDALLAQSPQAQPVPAATPYEGLDDGAAGQPSDTEADADLLVRLTDLYRYFGERDGLEFAFTEPPELAQVREADARVRQRMRTIEDAVRELLALPAFAARPPTAPDSKRAADPENFLREGILQVAQVTLGRSLERLRVVHAQAWQAAPAPVLAKATAEG